MDRRTVRHSFHDLSRGTLRSKSSETGIDHIRPLQPVLGHHLELAFLALVDLFGDLGSPDQLAARKLPQMDGVGTICMGK